jgi:hypothetical protein
MATEKDQRKCTNALKTIFGGWNVRSCSQQAKREITKSNSNIRSTEVSRTVGMDTSCNMMGETGTYFIVRIGDGIRKQAQVLVFNGERTGNPSQELISLFLYFLFFVV